MSETTEQPGGDAAPEPQSQTPTEAQTSEVAATEGVETSTEAAPAEPEPKPEPKPKRTDRHIAHLTARAAEEQRLRESAERRAEAAEALLRAGKPDSEETPPPPRQPMQDVREEARKLVEEEKFNARLSEIDAKGKTEIGADAWEQAKATLTGLGAVNNQAFLQALAEAENPHRLFANLADDPDTLMDLLKRPGPAMAARIGRMDAELSRPVVKPLSAAPTPAPRVQTAGVVKEFDPYNPPAGMSMKAWNAEMDKRLPSSLGGKRKSA